MLGTFTSNLTSQRRVAVPKIFRKELGRTLIIAKWYENCLVVVSRAMWQELMNKLTGKSELLTSPVRDTDRFVLGSAYELKPDAQGRVVLPEKLVKYSKLRSEVVFVGLGKRVEIWDRSEWARREEYLSRNADELVEKLANGGSSAK